MQFSFSLFSVTKARKSWVPKKYLMDYVSRREINSKMNEYFLELVKNKTIDFYVNS